MSSDRQQNFDLDERYERYDDELVLVSECQSFNSSAKVNDILEAHIISKEQRNAKHN